MDEIIVRVMRAIASIPRLRVLSCLARNREMTPTTLVSELDVPLNALSLDLRTLTTAGLVQRRKSGAWCYYRFGSPYGGETLSGQLAAWLTRFLRAPEESVRNLGPQEARDDSSDPESLLHQTVFEAATAFTDLRRLQILRHLAREGAATTQQLINVLSMSEQAVSRHTTKLRRRGYLQTQETEGRTLTYQLSSTPKTSIHAQMFAIVRSVWDKI